MEMYIPSQSPSLIPHFLLVTSHHQLRYIKEMGLWSKNSKSGFGHRQALYLQDLGLLWSLQELQEWKHRAIKDDTDKTKWKNLLNEKKSSMKCKWTSIYGADVLLKIMCRPNWFINNLVVNSTRTLWWNLGMETLIMRKICTKNS